MKHIKTFVLALLALLFTFGAMAQSSGVPRMGTAGLNRLDQPSLDDARQFFNWGITKQPVFRIAPGSSIETPVYEAIPGFSEFRRGGNNQVLTVENTSYTPAQPLVAFDKVTEAMQTMGLDYKVQGVGSFDSDRNIFAQFRVNDGEVKDSETQSGFGRRVQSDFIVDGKPYSGLITMAKGNDASLPLSVWLTIVCIVCANTFRMALKARKGNKHSLTIRQTKNSGERVSTLNDEIVALFKLQESVIATLQHMAKQPITMTEAERAFLGLLKPQDADLDLSQTGKTRLENSLGRYKDAFNDTKAGTHGQTREDWFNAVTYVDTHGRTDSKRFDPDKQFVSSEFGAYADRKQHAFELAANPASWNKTLQTGEDILNGLLARPVTVSATPVQAESELARLLAK